MLDVRLHDEKVGTLQIKENGNLQFRYEPAYVERQNAVPLSQILPLQTEGFPHRTCLAFFANLLPEEGPRDRVAEILGISASNTYRMLERIGGDCAGAVMLCAEDEPAPETSNELRTLDSNELEKLVTELEDRPLAIDEAGGARLSLAGSQPKAPVIYDGAEFSLPLGGQPPTTHILKPAPTRFPGLVDNEFFCMRLAKDVDLPVAEVQRLETVGGVPFLLVERYDRDLTVDPIRRLHQEDMCQALGKLPHEKYQDEGGPLFREVMGLLDDVSPVAAQDRRTLWSALVFNYLIGNCDAHGKNFSLLYDTTAPHLSPLYDLVSTAVYPELHRRLAMSIDGAHQLDEVDSEAWNQLASEARVSALYARQATKDLADLIVQRARELAGEPNHMSPVVSDVLAGIEQRAETVSRITNPSGRASTSDEDHLTALAQPATTRPTISVASTAENAELLETITIARDRPEPTVVMTLAQGGEPSTSLPDLKPGDRLLVSAELEVTTDCPRQTPDCVKKPYAFSPDVEVGLLLAPSPTIAVPTTEGAVLLGQSQRRTLSHERHHDVFVFDTVEFIVPNEGLSWTGASTINCVITSRHSQADPENVLVIGQQEPGGGVRGNMAGISVARFRPSGQSVPAPQRTTKRQIVALPVRTGSRGVVYSQRLDELRAGEQLRVRAGINASTRHLGYPVRVTTQVILSDSPASTDPGTESQRVVPGPPLIALSNGRNCLPTDNHMSIAKVGAVRIVKDAKSPLFVNVTVTTGDPLARGKSEDQLNLLDGGYLAVTRYPADRAG